VRRERKLTSDDAPNRLARHWTTAMATRHITHIPGYSAPHSFYSHAVVANGFGFMSGQIPVGPPGPTGIVGTTMQEQTRQSLRNVKTILEAIATVESTNQQGR